MNKMMGLFAIALVAISMTMRRGSTISKAATMIPKWEGLSTPTDMFLPVRVSLGIISLHIA